VPTPVFTHIIGFSALIAVFIAVSLYAFTTVDIMNRRNMEQALSVVSYSLAGSLRNLILAGGNNSLLTLNLPVEVYYRSGYNVYIGNGSVLAQFFPALRNQPGFDPGGLYVIASSPDMRVWSPSLVLGSADLYGRRIYVANGTWVLNTSRVGFDPNNGYVETGVPWLCRESLYVLERSGLNLSNYLVKVVFNPSTLKCSYGLLNFTPTPSDIRFADTDGKTPLPYWIESWNSTNAVVWVQIPSLQANSNKTIFMYWGNPLATSRSNPNIFTFFYNFSNVNGPSDLSPTWGILPVNTTSWSITSFNLSGVVGVAVNASFPQGVSPTLLTLFTETPLQLNPVGEGLIVEGWGAPLTLNDQDWRLALYNITGGLQWFGIQYQPPVIDPFLNISNYTVIYGNWSVVSAGSETLLNAYNYSNITIGGSAYWAAAIVRYNPPSNAPPGQEEYQILFKVQVQPDNVLRGLIISQDTSLSMNMFIAVNSSGDTLELWAGKVDDPNSWTRLDFQGGANPSWVFIYADMLGPGVSNHLTVKVYDADTGDTLLFYSKQNNLIPSDPNYVGGFALSTQPIPSNSLYDDLVAARYNYKVQSVNLTAITFTGLPANWSVTISSGDFAASATANSSGVAVVDVSTNPILGVGGPVYITLYDDQGSIVTTFVINSLVSGGTVFVFLPQLTQPAQQLGAAIHASGVPATGNTPVYTIVFHNSTQVFWVNTNITASQGQLVLSGVGYFNNTVFYVIYNTTGYYNVSAPTYSYFNSTYYGYMDTGLIVIGAANGYGKATGSTKVIQTSGFYWVVRARPFTYPEPLVQYGPVESASPPSMPQVNFTVKPYIVFSSKLAVDLALLTTPSGDSIVVMIVRGVRGA
jgi:hypothetical protein